MLADHRFHALDAVRAGALLLGIVLHACMSFFLPIPAQDVSQSSSLAVLFYVIHMFRMSLFFMLAGFFAHMSLHRKGLSGFVRERCKRIVLPMLASWIVMAPLLGVITVWGLTRTFGDMVAEAPPMPDMGVPLTHLWFLYYLCLIYVGFLALRWFFGNTLGAIPGVNRSLDRLVQTLVGTFVGPLLLGLPLAWVFFTSAVWSPWFGIPTPDFGLDPKLPAMTAYGLAFTVGWWLHRQPQLLHTLPSKAVPYLFTATALTALCLRLAGTVPSLEDPFAGTAPAWHKPVYILAYVTAIWFWVFGLLATGLRFLSAPSLRWRYLADASYWMYIVHLPIVFVLQVLVSQWSMHWLIKFPLILIITMIVLLLSYQWLVRPTRLGRWLGSSQRPQPA